MSLVVIFHKPMDNSFGLSLHPNKALPILYQIFGFYLVFSCQNLPLNLLLFQLANYTVYNRTLNQLDRC